MIGLFASVQIPTQRRDRHGARMAWAPQAPSLRSRSPACRPPRKREIPYRLAIWLQASWRGFSSGTKSLGQVGKPVGNPSDVDISIASHAPEHATGKHGICGEQSAAACPCRANDCRAIETSERHFRGSRQGCAATPLLHEPKSTMWGNFRPLSTPPGTEQCQCAESPLS